MKILVINSTGNVGKSFIAREVLYPLLSEEKTLYEIEKFNEGSDKLVGKNVHYKCVEPSKIDEIVPELLLVDNAIIDVGASSVDEFLQNSKEHNLFNMIDMIVIPTVLESKQVADTIKITKELKKYGGDEEKMFIVLNKIKRELNDNESIEQNPHFDSLYSNISSVGVEIGPEYRLREYEIIDKISELKLNIADVLADKTDYMKEIEKIKNDENMPKEEKLKSVKELYDKHLMQKRAKEMQKDFERLATRLAVFIK